MRRLRFLRARSETRAVGMTSLFNDSAILLSRYFVVFDRIDSKAHDVVAAIDVEDFTGDAAAGVRGRGSRASLTWAIRLAKIAASSLVELGDCQSERLLRSIKRRRRIWSESACGGVNIEDDKCGGRTESVRQIEEFSRRINDQFALARWAGGER